VPTVTSAAPVDPLSLPLDVVDSSPVLVLASGPRLELPLVVPVLELAADSEVAGGIVVNADVSACGDWQAGRAQSTRERGLSLGRMISSLSRILTACNALVHRAGQISRQ
jgi:hypothetical protein